MEILLKIVMAIALVLAMSLFMAFPTMWLWNWLMPDIFGLIEINVWQALGMNFLSGILIKPTNSNNSK